ncbi:hypothetical protein NL676_001626 [Syzygium grande]|nr:hypothetical protein NL676_001626 [Syzygium grande]
MVFKFGTIDLTEEVDVSTLFLPPPSPSSSTVCLPLGKSFTRAMAVAGRVAEGASLGFTASAVEVSCWRQQKSSDNLELQSLRPQVQLRKFTYQELKVATGNFGKENVLGQGGFGKVYRGILVDGSPVAIKRCAQLFGHAEVQVGSMARHRNLIQMLGFCDPTEQQKPFKKRNIIHRDIKPSNILLDENFKPLIADFGLAKFMNHEDWNQQLQKLKSAGAPHQMAETEAVNNRERSFWALERSAELRSTFRLCGTYGYMPPEYVMQGELSAKNDVFAFGMVLLELVSGFKVIDLLSDRARKGINEFEWVKYRLEHNELGGLIDPSLRGDYDENEAKKLVKLALFCIQSPPTKRPTTSEVVRILKGSCIDERWESEKEGIALAVDIGQTSSQSWGTVTDSASHLDPEELSGPR